MSVAVFSNQDPRERFEANLETIVYTSTHDTPTLAGYLKRRFIYPDNEDAWCDGSFDEKTHEAFERVLKNVLTLPNDVAVIPLQDILELDDSARMNVPGTAEGNWAWRCPSGMLTSAVAEKLRALVKHVAR